MKPIYSLFSSHSLTFCLTAAALRKELEQAAEERRAVVKRLQAANDYIAELHSTLLPLNKAGWQEPTHSLLTASAAWAAAGRETCAGAAGTLEQAAADGTGGGAQLRGAAGGWVTQGDLSLISGLAHMEVHGHVGMHSCSALDSRT